MMITLTTDRTVTHEGALLIATQVYENYAWREDGSLDTENPYWKAKGGEDYLITNVDAEASEAEIALIVDAVRDRVECDDGAFREYIIRVRLTTNDFTFGDWQDQFIKRIPNPRAP